MGRELELGILIDRWKRVEDGVGQVVLVSGEAGIGKSRLVKALKDHVIETGHPWLAELYCSPYHRHTAFFPVINFLERVVFRFEKGESPERRVRRLETSLVQFGFELTDAMPTFLTLMSLPAADKYPVGVSPELQRQRTLRALLKLFQESAKRQPVLLVIEDLHWSDPSLRELLGLIIDEGPKNRIVALITFRPELPPPWSPRSELTPITLNRLLSQQAKDFIKHIAKGKELPAEVVQQLLEKTDGVPLFVEEMTQTILESPALEELESRYEKTSAPISLSIPTTLRDSLMARLDRLSDKSTAKRIAQLGATWGREFPLAYLQAVEPLNAEDLNPLLEAGLIYRRGEPPHVTYIFKHALIQEAAYESLLKRTRREYHRRIAEVLLDRFPETVEIHPEFLAHHYTEAGLTEEAIHYWKEAGQNAVERSANLEAIGHLGKALELVRTLPEARERTEAQLDLLIRLGGPQIAAKGYAAAEIGEVFTEARDLSEQVGQSPKLFDSLQGLGAFHLVRGELKEALGLSERLTRLAERLDNRALIVEASLRLGITSSMLGRLAPALEQFERVATLYDREEHRSHSLIYGQDTEVSCLCHMAVDLWLTGYPDRALAQTQRAVRVAKRINHAFSLSWALLYSAMVHTLRREPGEVREQTEALASLSEEHGFRYRLAQAHILNGWTVAHQGEREEEAVEHIQKGIEAVERTGAVVYQPYYLMLLAEAQRKAGQNNQSMETLAEALSIVYSTRESFLEAELYRLEGNLFLSTTGPRPSRAKACFLKSLQIARRQEAKSLELRAALSLARLEGPKEKTSKARSELEEICSRFTEGFQTADFRDAQALLSRPGEF